MHESSVGELKGVLQRVFCLPITRSTLRELQNGLMYVTRGDQNQAKDLLETLITGTDKVTTASQEAKGALKHVIEQFMIPCRTAQEIFERGEWVSLVTSDLVTKEDQAIFLNRIRRTDGQELQFVADADGLANCALHFLTRLDELKKSNLANTKIGELKLKFQLIAKKVEELMAP